jgi:hypothetical protein
VPDNSYAQVLLAVVEFRCTVPLTIAGDAFVVCRPGPPDQSGLHVLGLPEQPIDPAASSAFKVPLDTVYMTPLAPAGDPLPPTARGLEVTEPLAPRDAIKSLGRGTRADRVLSQTPPVP